jgi:hypothetical protein
MFPTKTLLSFTVASFPHLLLLTLVDLTTTRMWG